MKELRGKTAIVTGASRGLGVYIAKAMAQEGMNLALAARSVDALEETRRICEAAGVRAIAVACDVTSQDDLRRLVAAAEREFGTVDVLVNNAGIELSESFVYLSIEQLDELLRVNLNAPIWLTKMVLPSMLARRSGAIVNVSSLAGKAPTPYNAIYSASKAGLIGLTESLGLELHGSGVTVGVVCPGFVADAGMWAKHEADGVKAPPLTRAVAPQKVADGVIKAIRGAPEVIVASGPMRPLLAFGQIAPGMKRGMVRRMGITRVFAQVADRSRIGEDRPDREGAKAAAQAPTPVAIGEDGVEAGAAAE
jgi:short-subunit dehydrogenase